MNSLAKMALNTVLKPSLSHALQVHPSRASRCLTRPLTTSVRAAQQNVSVGHSREDPSGGGSDSSGAGSTAPVASDAGRRRGGGSAVARRGPSRGSALAAPMVMGDLAPFPSFGRFGSFLRDIEDEMNSMLNLFGSPSGGGGPSTLAARVPTIPVDIREDDKAIYITADAPGVNRDNLKVSVDRDSKILTIEGERKQEHEDDDEGVRRIERSYGVFVRRFQLPDNVDTDDVDAKLEHGQLRITVPKTDKKREEDNRHTVDIK